MNGYKRPDWFTKNVLNRGLMLLGRTGISLAGHQTLAVRGRKSGEWRTVPVNPLTFDGERYLVAPRGETDWVRNIRVAGGGELRRGSKAEAISVEEVPDEEKEPILRAYLKKWAWETGQFFEGVKADSPEEDVRRIAPRHPIFRIASRDGA
jgi:deazaflavin-dependent oxidoreductase (nitroreductase family)